MAGESTVLSNVAAFEPPVRLPQSRRVRCAFRAGDRTLYPHVDEVIWIQAKRNYSQVFVSGSSFIVREVLLSLERRLAQFGFIRVQRSSIINLDHIVEIRRERRGRYALILSDGSNVVVPAAVRDRVEHLLGVQ